jgi:hypothetical protein
MLRSLPFAKILARLAVRGAVLSTADSQSNSKYEGFVPLIGANGKLDPSVLGVGTVSLGDVEAEYVTFVTPPENDLTVTNVRDAINNITKDNGLALIRSKNLTDVADSTAAFNSIKKAAAVTASGNVVGGIVGLAGQTEVEAGTDTSTDASIGATLLAVSPSTAKTTYLSKIATGSQTINSALVLPGNPTTNLQAATKQYVDAAVAASQSFPTGLAGGHSLYFHDLRRTVCADGQDGCQTLMFAAAASLAAASLIWPGACGGAEWLCFSPLFRYLPACC